MTDAPTTPDPIEIAMEAEAAGVPPSGVATRVLAKQEQLIGWQIAGERAGFALKVLTAAAGLAVAAILGLMAWNAAQDRSVVIDPFRTPADLAQQGSDGPALANSLQDKVSALQAGTRFRLVAAQLQAKGATEVRVQIPATGVSVSDVDQALRAWLGHQTHVTGELARVASGPEQGALALNVRVGNAPGERIVQPDGDVDALLARAAEHVYGRVDPVRYASWLGQSGRRAEGLALLHRTAASPGPAAQRGYAWFQLAAADGETRGDLQLRQRYLLEAQKYGGVRLAANDLGVVENTLGHSEAALRYWRYAAEHPKIAGYTAEGMTATHVISQGNVSGLSGDFTGGLRPGCYFLGIEPCRADTFITAVLAAPERLRDGERNIRSGPPARYLAMLHQPSAALRISDIGLQQLDLLAAGRPLFGATARAFWLEARIEARRQLADWPGVLAAVEARERLTADGGPTVGPPHLASRALALAGLGDRTGARAAAARLPADCYRCLFVRAMVVDQVGDHAGADALFAEAVRQAPSLALSDVEWARVLVARDAARATRIAAKAAKKAPKWADPLEVWGEALLAKGDAGGAVRKFQAAEAFAPHWGRLHLKWGEALAKLGRPAEAQAQWRAAAGLDLTPDERAELARVMR